MILRRFFYKLLVDNPIMTVSHEFLPIDKRICSPKEMKFIRNNKPESLPEAPVLLALPIPMFIHTWTGLKRRPASFDFDGRKSRILHLPSRRYTRLVPELGFEALGKNALRRKSGF